MKILALILSLALTVNSDIVKIDAGNGVNRGRWGPVDMCPTGSYAAAMEFKYEPRQHMDDTCGNALKFYCFDVQGQLVGYVTSAEGKFGTWQGIRMCPSGNFLTGYAMKVEGLVGNFDDDLGVVDVRAKCQDGTVLDGLVQQITKVSQKTKPLLMSKDGSQRKAYRNLVYKLTTDDFEKPIKNKTLHIGAFSNDGEDGSWGPIASCPPPTKVCGLQTEVEDEHIYNDDAGLCNVVLFCCD